MLPFRPMLMTILSLIFMANTLVAFGETPLAQPAPAILPQLIAEKPPIEPVVPWLFARKMQHLNHLYQFDQTPLAGRQPLIVLPGRSQEGQGNPWWKKLARAIEKQPSIQKQYKFYLFLYDSTEPLSVLSPEFGQELDYFTKHLPENSPKMVIFSYSLGGLVARDTLIENPALLEKTQTIFGMAVPYHGSLLFDKSWFDKFFKNPSPLRNLSDKMAYQAFMFGRDNLVQDMGWRNFDGSIPNIKVTKFWHKSAKDGSTQTQSPIYLPEPKYRSTDAHVLAFKKKLVIYTSYIENAYTKTRKKRKPFLATTSDGLIHVPANLLGTVLPVYGYTVHGAMNYMNWQIANIPTYTPKAQWAGLQHLYRFNDGVIPLSSTLYLPERNTPYNEPLGGFESNYDGCFARVFYDVDHVDLAHYRWPEGHLTTSDIFHAEAGERKPMAWLFYDLDRLAAHKNPQSPCGL
ncbi:MAG: hypothetical protein H2174_06205 [Vampirovibrio sp.]|nr:hypothetical protein [Vampirovibrio sp.]